MLGESFIQLSILRTPFYSGEMSLPWHPGSDPGTGGPEVAYFYREPRFILGS
jgi:hypothetical protein